MAQGDKVQLKIKRRASAESEPYWEEFSVPWEPMMNVIAALMAIQRNPVNAAGQKTTPVVYSSNCLEEVCGACTMVINGRVRQSCSALIDQLEQPITLEPMAKFPVVRDLYVERQKLFDDFKRVHAWVSIDGTHDLGAGPTYSAEIAETRYELSRCMACGCCVDACPNYGPHSTFIGAAPINQARLFNLHPTGAYDCTLRLDELQGEGGISGCGNAQNCVRVCPKEIPLTTSLGDMMRATTKHAFFSLFRR